MANESAASFAPLQTTSYYGTQPIDDYAVLDAPGRSMFARGFKGDTSSADLTVPSRVLVAGGGGTAKLSAPSRAYSLAGTVQVVGRMTHERGFVGSVTATGATGGTASAALEAVGRSIFAHGGGFAKLTKRPGTTTGQATVGVTGSLDIYVPSRSLDASGTIQNFGSASLVAPSGKSLWGVSREMAVPGIALHATGYPVLTPTYKGFAINAEHGGVTEYANYDFDFIVRFDGRYFGAGANGLVLLEGVNDQGANIDASIEFHPTDFGTSQQKRLPYVYVGARGSATGQMLVSVAPDEGSYRSALTTRQHRNRRAQLPRGLKARYWSLKIENQNGGDLDVDTIEAVTEVLRRKL